MTLALKDLPAIDDPRVLVGHNRADDAGVLKLEEDFALVNTVDLLAPVVDDPFDFGFIAAVNCLSDIYAMGGEPLVCLNVVGWPTRLPPDVLGAILQGSEQAVRESGAVVLGGHTFQGDEIRFGLAVTGRIDPRRVFTNAGAKKGDALVLTKPLGTGTVVACSVSRGAAPADTYAETLASMKTSNGSAARAMREADASACTDITGFGFLGHASELAAGSERGLEIHASALPVFPGVRDLLAESIVDGSHKMNRNSFLDRVRFEGVDANEEILLFSSETSGGLLIAVDPSRADELLSRLHDAGLERASRIGSVTEGPAGQVTVRP